MNLKFTIGILGGGQLARMTISAAMQYGIRVKVLDRSSDAPVANYTCAFTCGDPQDFATVMAFAEGCDAVTIDSEHVNADALVALAAQGIIVAPFGAALKTIQNKCRQKEFYAAHDLPTAPFQVFASRDELAAAPLEFPIIQKKATAGYDGQGVLLLKSQADLEKAFEGESLVEHKIDIAREIAVIVATDRQGANVIYDAVEMVFDTAKNILKYQVCPADLSAQQLEAARSLALAVATKLGSVGLLAVEMFLTRGGELLINEMAPRPHNSGHHTIEAAATSQYENLVRILAGLPLGASTTTRPSLMLNLLGPEKGAEQEYALLVTKALRMENAYVHLYGKTELRPFRKMGHITLTGPQEQLIRQYRELSGSVSS